MHGQIGDVAVAFDKVIVVGAEQVAALTGGEDEAAVVEVAHVDNLAIAGHVILQIGFGQAYGWDETNDN